MKRTYQVSAILLLVFSAFVARESLRLKYYTSLGPGPGFFPLWLSLLLAVLSGVMLYQATYRTVDPRPVDFFHSPQGYFRILAICGAWIWAALALEPLGYCVTMAVFCPILLMTLGSVRWYVVILITLFGSLVVFWIFNGFLRISLPFGPIDGIFGPLDDLLDGIFLGKAG